jgi:hypothetical protein
VVVVEVEVGVGVMNPNPKKIPPRLSKEKYHKLRVFLYNLWDEHCPECNAWRDINQMHIHHDPSRGSGGGDHRIWWCCYKCHPE